MFKNEIVYLRADIRTVMPLGAVTLAEYVAFTEGVSYNTCISIVYNLENYLVQVVETLFVCG